MQQNRRQFLATPAAVMLSQAVLHASSAGVTTWQASRTNFPEIVYPSNAAPPTHYAAEQLEHYLRHILGTDVQTTPARGCRILLEEVTRADLGDEGFELVCQGRELFIRGTPTGIVYGAFDFLRRHAGCNFAGFAPDGEDIPKRERLQLAAFQSVRKPRLWYRGYQMSWREPLELIVKNLDWMAKNGLNYVMYRPLPDDVTDPIGSLLVDNPGGNGEFERLRYTEAWFREYVQPEVLRRGLKLDFSHHNLSYWLPSARYYDQHPEWFALMGGKRIRLMVDPGQLSICTTNEEGLDMLKRNVLAFLRANPAVGIVGVLQEDGIGMCQCDRCVRADLDSQDAFRPYHYGEMGYDENISKSVRLARLVNQVARAVKEEFPDRLVGHAAYGDVRFPPRGVTMEPNVVTMVAMYAGKRDAAHPLAADSPSAMNRFNFDMLTQWKRVHPGKVILYEYYMGLHSIKSFPYPMAKTICQEWPALKALGIKGATVQCWSTNHETYGMNNLAFARSGWEDNVDPDRILEEYVRGEFGAAADQVAPLFRGLNEAVDAIAQGSTHDEFYLSVCPPRELRAEAATVGYFLTAVGDEVQRRAATPRGSGREEAQLRALGAVLEYWRQGAAIMRLELLADRAAKQGQKAAAAAFYEKAVEDTNELILYANAQPPRGWLSATTAASWRGSAMKWRAAAVTGAPPSEP